MGRDEFPDSVKRTVAERVSYHCSNPACRRCTVTPHTDPKKSLKTGEACHIRAAAPGGPRYDPTQTVDQRRNIENAIWLCADCSTRIDRDESAHTVETILAWKHSTEDWVKAAGADCSLPKLSLTTIAGRTVSEIPNTITFADLQREREHSLVIENLSLHELLAVDARVQLPEPITYSGPPHRPPGSEVMWTPIRPQMVVKSKNGGFATRSRPPLPSNVYRLQIERLAPGQQVVLSLVTSLTPWEEVGFSMTQEPWRSRYAPPDILYFVDGSFQFIAGFRHITKPFFAPIDYQPNSRAFSIQEVSDNHGNWKPIIFTAFS
jgi:hypothetical protein